MTIFNFLGLLGGLCLFLFGMNVMGNSLEKRAGGSLKSILSKITTGKMTGFLLGLGVTAIIQSSSATTVMVVGFVNSGLMTLRQAINVIMGANVGTAVTAWMSSSLIAGLVNGRNSFRMISLLPGSGHAAGAPSISVFPVPFPGRVIVPSTLPFRAVWLRARAPPSVQYRPIRAESSPSPVPVR